MEISVACSNCKSTIKIAKEAYEMGISVVCPGCKKMHTPAGDLSDAIAVPAISEGDIKAAASGQGVVQQDFGAIVYQNDKKQMLKYPLKPGKQVVGRKDAAKPSDVMVETSDAMMSRSHFTLDVKPAKSGEYECLLSDNQSKNATKVTSFAKTNTIGAGDVVVLKDGDVISAGNTLLVYKAGSAIAPRPQQVENKGSSSKTEVWRI